MTGKQAVVIGGSVAGLLAAAAAAEHFERVVVVERDELADEPVARKGAPQGAQIHILLPIGEEVIGELLPGLREEMVEAGCVEYNHCADVASLTAVGWLPRVKMKAMEVKGFRRPLLEWVIRRRVAALENVEIRRGAVSGLTVDEQGTKLTGVLVKDQAPISADLVVDAGGRGTKTPKWMSELGFPQPAESEVRIYIGYATQYVRLGENAFKGEARGVGTYPQPAQPVGGAILPSDHGLAAIAAFGMMKHYPPADREGMIEFLAGAPSPLISEILRESEPVSEVRAHHIPGNLRRRWEELDDRPGRFVVVGDAVASFNPIYGQGLTMAAFAAKFLRDALAASGGVLDAVPDVFQRTLAAKIEVAFEISARGDVAYEGAEVKNYEPPSTEDLQRLGRLWELAAENDLEVMEALTDSNFTMRPELIETDSIRSKAESEPSGERQEIDPERYPETIFPEGAGRDARQPVGVYD